MRRIVLGLSLLSLLSGSLAAQGIWSPSVQEPGLVSTPTDDYQPTITQDLKTIYFSSARAGGLGSNDIWMCTRTDVLSPWSAPTNLGAPVNTVSGEFYLSVRGDNLELIFSSNRAGGAGDDDLWVSTRASTAAPWGAPTNILALNTSSFEDDPALSDDGLVLYFTVGPGYGAAGAGIARASRASTAAAFGPATLLTELDTASFEHSPATAKSLNSGPWFKDQALIFSSTDVGTLIGNLGSSDFYLVVRSAPGVAFANINIMPASATNLADINTNLWDFNPDETADGYNFYWSKYENSSTAGGTDANVYRSDRNLPVAFQASGTLTAPSTITIYSRYKPTAAVPGILHFLWITATTIPPIPLPGVAGTLETPLGSATFLIPGVPGDADGKASLSVPNPFSFPPGTTIPMQGAIFDLTVLPTIDIRLSRSVLIN